MNTNEYHKQWRTKKGEAYKQDHRKRNLEWTNKNKEKVRAYKKEIKRARRKLGITDFCCKDYQLIENYDKALKDEFDYKLWSLHHRDENMYSSTWLRTHGQYNGLTPDKLIWLPADDHRSDASLAVTHPEQSKWHQRIYDR